MLGRWTTQNADFYVHKINHFWWNWNNIQKRRLKELHNLELIFKENVADILKADFNYSIISHSWVVLSG